MKVVKLTKVDFHKILSIAERILKSGGVVIAPTDTVYGILGDATRPEVIKKIFEMKGRPREKALPIFIRDIAAARKYAYISDAKARFLEKVWPGPVTVVFQHKEKLPKILTGGLETIGIRIPNHQFLLELLYRLDFPLVQTSANISGQPPAKNLKEIKEYFDKNIITLRREHMRTTRIDLVIDGGEILKQQSTAIDFTGKEPLILRTGVLSKAELDQLLSSVRV